MPPHRNSAPATAVPASVTCPEMANVVPLPPVGPALPDAARLVPLVGEKTVVPPGEGPVVLVPDEDTYLAQIAPTTGRRPEQASQPIVVPAGVSRVRVDLQRFGPQATGEVVLEGRWALLPADGERPIVARPVGLKRGPLGPAAPGGGADAVAGVEAMSELVADLARDIAAAIRALPSGLDESG